MEGKILLNVCVCLCVCVCTTSQISNNFSIVVLIAQKVKIYAVPGSQDHKWQLHITYTVFLFKVS